jgi:hypothetical protein
LLHLGSLLQSMKNQPGFARQPGMRDRPSEINPPVAHPRQPRPERGRWPFPAADRAIDSPGGEPARQLAVQQDVVDPDAVVPLEAVAEVLPERVDRRAAVQLPQRVGPGLRQQLLIRGARLGEPQRVAYPMC